MRGQNGGRDQSRRESELHDLPRFGQMPVQLLGLVREYLTRGITTHVLELFRNRLRRTRENAIYRGEALALYEGHNQAANQPCAYKESTNSARVHGWFSLPQEL